MTNRAWSSGFTSHIWAVFKFQHSESIKWNPAPTQLSQLHSQCTEMGTKLSWLPSFHIVLITENSYNRQLSELSSPSSTPWCGSLSPLRGLGIPYRHRSYHRQFQENCTTELCRGRARTGPIYQQCQWRTQKKMQGDLVFPGYDQLASTCLFSRQIQQVHHRPS